MSFKYKLYVDGITACIIIYLMCILYCTRLNAAAFITFELAEGGGAYSRAAFIRGQHLLFQRGVTVLILLLRSAMVQAVGTVLGPGVLEKESHSYPRC